MTRAIFRNAAAEVRQALEAHPHLPDAVHEVATRAGVPESIAREHLHVAVLEVLDVLGTSYVREMGEAIARVERLRSTVYGFYERVLTGAERRPDPAGLRDTFARLREAVKQLIPPEEWARQHAEQIAADPMAGTRPGRSRGSQMVDYPRPQGPPRWETQRDVRRTAALTQRLRLALRSARGLHPDLVEAALRGDSTALETFRGRLRAGGMDADRATRVTGAVADAVAAMRNPDLGYALGGHSGGPRPRAFGELPGAQQDAVRGAAAADPEFVRTMVNAEITYGDPRGAKRPWRPEEMDRFCADHGITGQARADLEAALARLNQEHRESIRRPPESGAGTPLARERAALLDEAAAGLGLPTTGKIAAQLAGSSYLRELAAANPDYLLDLAGAWLKRAEELEVEKKPVPSLRRYVEGLMRTQVRGLVGELTAVFRLGEDVWVLKAPDLRVTDPGTDFVVVVRKSGEIWFCDNKSLSSAGLSRVTSLVENIPKNMADDLAELGPEIERLRPPVPAKVADAIANARTASSEISRLVEGLTPEELVGDEVQAQITRICDRNGVRRVVTNAGGELSYLTAILADRGIDLANLEGATPVHPQRPLARGGTEPATGAGGGGGTP